MSDFEELDPSIENALRDVPPASASLRDAHIAAALAEVAPSSRKIPRRLRIIGSAAAAAVLVLGGFAVFGQNSSDNQQFSGGDTTVPPKASANCAEEFSGLWSEVGDSTEIIHNNQRYALMFRDDNIDVYRATPPCSSVGTLGYREALVARDNESRLANQSSVCSYTTEPIARFTDSANGDTYSFVLVHTDSGLSLHFEDRCNTPIATLALP